MPSLSLPRTLLVALILLVASSPVSAGAAVSGSWSSLGPDGGPVTALASPAGSPNVIYAGVFGGVFKSVDGGATWNSASRGLELLPAVDSLAIDPLHPSTLYAGASIGPRSTESSKVGVYKSVDGGTTWKPTGLDLDVVKIVIHPRFPQTIFVSTTTGLYQSSNGGGKWRLLSKGLPRGSFPIAFAIDPTSPRRMFGQFLLSTSPFQTALFKSLDGGFSWQPVQSDLLNILTLAIDPRSPQTIYASRSIGGPGEQPTGLFRSTNEGRSWTQCFVSGDPIRSLAFPPTQKSLVYAGGLPGLYRSLDGGATWSRLGHLPAEVRSVLVSATSATTVFVGADDPPQQAGVLKSTDGGISWTRSERGLTASRIAAVSVEERDSNTLWAVANRNLFKSSDRGRTWSQLLPDLEPILLSFQQVAASPVDPETVYVGRANGEILRSRDGGQTWAVAGDPIDDGTILKADPQDAATLWAAGFSGGIRKSTNGGDTWTALQASGIFFDLAFSPSSPSIVYAAGSNLSPKFAKALVLRSADAGASWTVVQEGGGLPGFDVVTLAVDPRQPETVYAVTDSSGDIHKTVDGGSTWSVVNSAFHDRTVQFLAAAPSGALYAAVQLDNVYESEDGGLTWAPLGEVPRPFSATSLAADPADPCRVYAGTADRGLLAFTRTGTAVCP